MNARLRINGDASDDLDEAWEYIARNDPLAADGFVRRVWEMFELLAENPRMGRKRDELLRGLRSLPEGNYIIYYRALEDGVEIMRVLHGARNQPTAWGKKGD